MELAVQRKKRDARMVLSLTAHAMRSDERTLNKMLRELEE